MHYLDAEARVGPEIEMAREEEDRRSRVGARISILAVWRSVIEIERTIFEGEGGILRGDEVAATGGTGSLS